MSFSLQAGRMQITKSGRTIFDTDDELAHNLTTNITATLDFPNLTANAVTEHISTTDYTLGSCHVACNTVNGSVRASLSSQNAALAYNAWFTIKEDAPIIWYLNGVVGSVYFDTKGGPRQICVYTVRVGGGVVTLRRTLHLPFMTSGSSITLNSHRLEFKLKAGLYT